VALAAGTGGSSDLAFNVSPAVTGNAESDGKN